jgi:hypothetical protein
MTLAAIKKFVNKTNEQIENMFLDEFVRLALKAKIDELYFGWGGTSVTRNGLEIELDENSKGVLRQIWELEDFYNTEIHPSGILARWTKEGGWVI